MGVALILLLFGVTWGFGLPSTNSLDLGSTRLVFQIIFVLVSATLGFVMFVVFCVFIREARGVLTSHFNHFIPGRTGKFITDNSVLVEKNLNTSGAGVSEMRPIGGSFVDSRQLEEGVGVNVSVMTEKEDIDGEQFANPAAILHEEEEEENEKESEPGMSEIPLDGEDDEDAPKNTKL